MYEHANAQNSGDRSKFRKKVVRDPQLQSVARVRQADNILISDHNIAETQEKTKQSVTMRTRSKTRPNSEVENQFHKVAREVSNSNSIQPDSKFNGQ